jgi:hypothetical protein
VTPFEEWWTKWWGENAIAATDTEEVWRANAEVAWRAGYMQALTDDLDNAIKANPSPRPKQKEDE